MNVAVVVRKFARTGGVERYAGALIAGLLDRGDDVTLVCARLGTEPPQGARVLKTGGTGLFLEPLKNIAFAWSSSRATRPGSFDVSISFSRTWGQDVMRAGHGTHRAYLRAMGFARRGGAVLDGTLDYLERRQYSDPGLKKVIAISERVKDEIVAFHGVDPSMVRVIHNGVEMERFGGTGRAGARKALGLEDGDFVVSFVGGGFERKGLARLLEAFSMIRSRRGKKLLVAGGDPKAEKYKALAARLGLGGSVIFAGPREDVESIYPAADVVALPSLYEPFGNTVLEGMACGVPVVVSAACGASEIYPESLRHCIVPDPCDAVALAAALERYTDPAERDRDGRASLEAARANTLEKALGRVFDLLSETAGRK